MQGRMTRDKAIGHRTCVMGQLAQAWAWAQRRRKSYVTWPCPMSCGPVLRLTALSQCAMALSHVSFPCAVSYVPSPCPMFLSQ